MIPILGFLSPASPRISSWPLAAAATCAIFEQETCDLSESALFAFSSSGQDRLTCSGLNAANPICYLLYLLMKGHVIFSKFKEDIIGVTVIMPFQKQKYWSTHKAVASAASNGAK